MMKKLLYLWLILGSQTLASCSEKEMDDESSSTSRLLGISYSMNDNTHWEKYTYDAKGRIDRVQNSSLGWKRFVYQNDTIYCNYENYQIAYSVKDNRIENWMYYPDPYPYDKNTPAASYIYKNNRLEAWASAMSPPTEIKWENDNIVGIGESEFYTYTSIPASYAAYQFSPIPPSFEKELYVMGLFGERSRNLPFTHTFYITDTKPKGGVISNTLNLLYKETYDYTIKDRHVVSCEKTREFADGTVDVIHYTLTWDME